MRHKNKRYRERYALEIPVSISWKDRTGHTRGATGMTKNMSPLGALLVCSSHIEEGCAIDLHFDHPIALGGCIPSRISASGTVVVASAAGGEDAESCRHGVRVIFDRFSFARL